MARPVVLTKQLAAASANNIALSQTPVSGTALTLNGSTVSAGVATLDTARRVRLTFGNEGANRTLVLTGTNGSGTPITETLAIASGAGGTVDSKQDFATITQALPLGGGWTAAVTLGTNAVGSTPWVVLNNHITPFSVGGEYEVLSGAVTCDVEITEDDPKIPIPIYQAGYSQAVPVPTPSSWPGMTGMNGTTVGNLNTPVLAARLTVTGGTGKAQCTLTQAGIRN